VSESNKPSKVLKSDEIVEQIVSDPSHIPNMIVLVGFLGTSNRTGHWRIYTTPSLSEYIEFREEDVVHSKSLVTEQNPLGGTIVWINHDANLLHTRAVSGQAQEEFLQGDIMSAFLAGASFGPIFTALTGNSVRQKPATIIEGTTCLKCYTFTWGGRCQTIIPAVCV
jgi:hypothetical protein